MGKTRLLEEVLAGRPHLWASAWDLGEAPALWPIAQLLRALDALHPTAIGPDRDRLGALLRGDTTASAGSRFALVQAVTEAMARGAAGAPLVAVVDDIHAADQATLEVLLAAGPRWRAAGVLLLTTRRSVDARTSPGADRVLARLVQVGEERPLAAMSRDDVRALAAAHGAGDLDEARLDRLMARAGGMPLYVEGLVRDAAAARRGPHGDLTPGLPRPLQVALRDRVARLGEPAGAVLDLAALVRGRVIPAVLARALSMSHDGVEAALETAVAEALLLRRPDGIHWSHQVYAEALVAALPPARARAGHAALLRALRDEAEDTLSARAAHALAAGHPDAPALAMEAGRAAEALFAWTSAADRYGRAAQVAADRDGRCDALLAQARALRRAGEPRAARAAVDAAGRLGLPHRAADIACARADIVQYGVADDEAVALLRAALETLPPDDHPARAAVLSRLVQHEVSLDTERDEVETLIAAALDAATRSGDADVLLEALVADLHYWRIDRLPARRAAGVRLSALKGVLARPAQRAEIARWEFNLALATCDGAAANRALRALERAAEALRTPQAHQWTLIRRSIQLQHQGRHDEIDGEALLAAGEAAGDPHAAFFAIGPQVWGAALRGERDRLRDWTPLLVDTLAEAWPQNPGVQLLGSWVHLQTGALDSARSRYGVWKAAGFAPTQWHGTLLAQCILAEIAVAVDDRDGCEVLVERLREHPEGYAGAGPMLPLGPVARHEALLLRFLGRHAEADRATARALTLCDRLGAPGVARLVRQEQDRPRSSTPAPHPTRSGPPLTAEMVEEGDSWRFVLGDREVRLRASKGFGYLAALAERPGEPVHVLELTSGARRA